MCGNAAIKSTYSTMYFIGSYALIIIGILSDKFVKAIKFQVFKTFYFKLNININFLF